MKAYTCDICKIAITDPYTAKMKEFYWACDYEIDGIYPKKAKRKQKLHLCGNCFEGLKGIFAKRSADPVPKEMNYAGCGQLCPHNTLYGCKVRENNGVCPLTNVAEHSGKAEQLNQQGTGTAETFSGVLYGTYGKYTAIKKKYTEVDDGTIY